jgi:hypothetical protein
MSESNNNIPMRITQLEEATAYEDGMYYATAKAGTGTKKINSNIIPPSQKISFEMMSNNKLWLNFYGSFVNGALGFANGELLSGYKYRVCSPSIITLPYDCNFKAKSGFIFHFFKFEDNVYKSVDPNLTSVNIRKGQQFKITIMRTTEDTSEVANINEFVSAITADNPITANFSIANYFHNANNWVQGSFDSNGGEIATTLRIRTDYIPYIDTISYTFGKIGSYKYDIYFYDINKNYISNLDWQTEDYTIENINNLAYIRLVFAPFTLRDILPNECINLAATLKNEVNNTCIELKKEILNVNTSNVLKDTIKNNNLGVESAVQTAVFKNNNYGYSNKIYNQFLITTDLHSDWIRFTRALDYSKENLNLDMVLCLGDVCDVPSQFPYFNWSENILNCDIPVLPIIGNHDACVVGGGTVYQTDEYLYNYFFSSALQEHNGEQHDNNSLYWYKDIENSYTNSTGTHTNKIRIIGLNQYGLGEINENRAYIYYKQAQIDWLIDLLDNTSNDTYVIILTHTAPSPNLNIVQSLWSDTTPIDLTSQYSKISNKDMLCEIIDAWINGTNVNLTNTSTIGEDIISVDHTFTSHPNNFICWLSGHSHKDSYCIPTNYPNQKIILFNCTTAIENQQDGDLGRNLTGKAQDCITLFSYDWDNNKIRLVRLGADCSIEGYFRRFVII